MPPQHFVKRLWHAKIQYVIQNFSCGRILATGQKIKRRLQVTKTRDQRNTHAVFLFLRHLFAIQKHYGIVGDLNQVIPMMIKAFKSKA